MKPTDYAGAHLTQAQVLNALESSMKGENFNVYSRIAYGDTSYVFRFEWQKPSSAFGSELTAAHEIGGDLFVRFNHVSYVWTIDFEDWSINHAIDKPALEAIVRERIINAIRLELEL